MRERGLRAWFLTAAAVTVVAGAAYAVAFSVGFDRADAGRDPGTAGAVVWPAALVAGAALVAALVLLHRWLTARAGRPRAAAAGAGGDPAR